jgi:hypothetical protein
MRKLTFLFLFPVLLASLAQAQTFEQLMDQARRQRDSYNEPLALEKFAAALKLKPDNYEALHNASLLASKVGNRMESDEDKRKYFTQAEILARQAIAANGADAEGYFVMAVAKGRMSLIETSSKERVKNSEEIKKNAQQALKFNNKHAGAWHVLGKWNFKIATLSFAERAAMNLLFGGVPEDASLENAINCYLNAIKYNPSYLLYHRDLAEAYMEADNPTAARKELTLVINGHKVTPDDGTIQQEARDLLAELD